MNGAFEQARELVARGRMLLDDLGLQVERALVDMEAWRIETLAGDQVAAERELRQAYDSLSAVGEKFILSTAAAFLAQTSYVLERFDEVERLAAEVEELATDDDIGTQALARSVRALVLGRAGRFDAAIERAQEGLEILAPTDAALLKFDALLDLAEVSRLAGLEADARAALEEAQDIAERKGSPAMSAVVQGRVGAPSDRSLVERTP
jgi:ATP/maltotriose-dependent transcriptional regulator MalT